MKISAQLALAGWALTTGQEHHLILTTIKMIVHPEKHKELSQTLEAIVDQLRRESGCLHADVYQCAGNLNDLLMIDTRSRTVALSTPNNNAICG